MLASADAADEATWEERGRGGLIMVFAYVLVCLWACRHGLSLSMGMAQFLFEREWFPNFKSFEGVGQGGIMPPLETRA